jgi:hypothetical protein
VATRDGHDENVAVSNASPAVICSPMTSDHQWASQKTSAEPNALVVMTRASCPASKATPTTDATRNDP